MSTDHEAASWQSEQTLRRLYHDEGLTQREIAERVGVGHATVQSALDRHDIETRGCGRRRTHSDADLVRHVRRVHNSLPFRVTQAAIDADDDAPHHSTFRRHFGSWTTALEAAGIDPDAPATPSAYRETLNIGQSNFLTRNNRIAHALVDAPNPFIWRETELSKRDIRRLREHEIITHADGRREVPPDEDVSWPMWRWSIADGVREWIKHNCRPDGTCPDCDATGIHNLGDGAFTCTNEACDSDFDRETALEVLGR